MSELRHEAIVHTEALIDATRAVIATVQQQQPSRNLPGAGPRRPGRLALMRVRNKLPSESHLGFIFLQHEGANVRHARDRGATAHSAVARNPFFR
jgi:hypothetical protein